MAGQKNNEERKRRKVPWRPRAAGGGGLFSRPGPVIPCRVASCAVLDSVLPGKGDDNGFFHKPGGRSMAKRRKVHESSFKAKVALEALKERETVGQRSTGAAVQRASRASASVEAE